MSGDGAKLPQAKRAILEGITGVRIVAVVMVGGRSLVVAGGTPNKRSLRSRLAGDPENCACEN
jgi:hypothetical protein